MKRSMVFLLALVLILIPISAMAIGGDDLPIPIEELINEATGIWQSILIITIVISVDVLLGVFLALKKKVFDIREMSRYVASDIVPFIGGLLLLAILSHFLKGYFTGVFFTSAVLVAARYVKDISVKVKELFS
jgi:hypothetical protein